MKLRSDSRMQAAKTVIPLLLPDTHAVYVRAGLLLWHVELITVLASYLSNASSTLLRLPQELKDRIYHFVYAGYCIHVAYHPHQKLHGNRILLSTCLRMHCDDPCCYQLKVELSVGFLRTCRQAYHEARNVFYTANIYKFDEPTLGRTFLQRISDYNLILRSVHLTIRVSKRSDERQWDNTLHELAENFNTVQNLFIDVLQGLWVEGNYDYNYTRQRYSPALGKRPFLKGLLELKKLPLKTFEIGVDIWSPRLHHLAEAGDYSWTPDQKRAWARSIKSAVLGKD